jgi:hypothetical protein
MSADRLPPDAHDDPVPLSPTQREQLLSLRQDAAPPEALWAALATRITDPAERERVTLPPAMQGELAALRRDQRPARDLWPAIEPRLHRRHGGSGRPRPWMAAAASLAAGLVIVFGLRVDRHPDSLPVKAPLRPSAEVLAATLTPGRDPELQPASYRPMSRETRALVRANLKIVDSAETQIQRALADDPDDAAYLQGLLASARAQQRHLRSELAAAP